MISHRAVLVAVVIAFVTGILGSLALRPPGASRLVPAQHAQGSAQQRIHWRLPISIASTSPVLGESSVWAAQYLRDFTNGAIQLDIYDPGELMPAFAITDAVRDGKVSVGHTWLGYDQGKIPASALIGATPFGMEPWEYLGWWYEGGGLELADELYSQHNIKPLLCGIISPETAGWFRKPVESLEDIRGLKIRFAGLGGKVLERAGASVTMLPGGEIFQALEKGAIDATEFSLPIIDQQLGFARVAKNNYYPGWHQTFTATHMVFNLDAWSGLSAADQSGFKAACMASTTRTLAAAEGRQGAVIAGFPAIGVKARKLPESVLRELQKITAIVLQEEAAKDEHFAAILKSQQAFSAEYALWKRLAYLPRDF
jgi:TRAP-type mannitol/chloroaromatic compound transport system substrate-binding protein